MTPPVAGAAVGATNRWACCVAVGSAGRVVGVAGSMYRVAVGIGRATATVGGGGGNVAVAVGSDVGVSVGVDGIGVSVAVGVQVGVGVDRPWQAMLTVRMAASATFLRILNTCYLVGCIWPVGL